MKIYGKESDYYDSALAYGQDPLCKWTRKFTSYENVTDAEFPKEYFGKTNWSLPENQRVDANLFSLVSSVILGKGFHLATGYVFFCGKVYPFVKVEKGFMQPLYFYNIAAFIKFKENKVPDWGVSPDKSWRRHFITNMKDIKDFFTAPEQTCESLHRVKGIPVYIVTGGEGVQEGGSLKAVSFGKIFDPYTCLQELDMYISGVLGGQSPIMIEIADIDKIVSKGFDVITSFRRSKER